MFSQSFWFSSVGEEYKNFEVLKKTQWLLVNYSMNWGFKMTVTTKNRRQWVAKES